MKKVFKRLVVIMLALCLCLSCMPFASAEDDGTSLSLNVSIGQEQADGTFPVSYSAELVMSDELATAATVNRTDPRMRDLYFVCVLTSGLVAVHEDVDKESFTFTGDDKGLYTLIDVVQSGDSLYILYKLDSAKVDSWLTEDAASVKADLRERVTMSSGTYYISRDKLERADAADSDDSYVTSTASVYITYAGEGSISTFSAYNNEFPALGMNFKQIYHVRTASDRIQIPEAPAVGDVSLTKVDSADNSITLSDVIFKLYTAAGEYVGSYTTDANGQIKLSGLAAGDYYFAETRPAQGYELLEGKINFTVKDGETTALTVTNTRSDIPDVFGEEHYAYIIGYPDGMVHPEGNITRAEVATIFFRLLNDATRQEYLTKSNSFTDVNEGNWFNTAVSTMAAMGVIKGYPDGTFRPNEYITRAEFAAIAARFDPEGNTEGAGFVDTEKHWAKPEIAIAANNGWILGYPDGTFLPDKYINRAEAMTMVNRVLQRIPRSVDDLLADMTVWPDNMNTNMWYYLAVQEATNSHEYTRYADGTEHWTALRETPDWTIYEK